MAEPQKASLSRIARLLAKSFLFSIPVVLVTVLLLFLTTRQVVKDTLTLLLFLEGGIGLLAGVGISLSNSPSVARVGELMFNSSPWSHEGEKHAQRVGLKWILSSTFLILIGIMISAL